MARPRKNAPATVTEAPTVDLASLAADVREDKLTSPGSKRWAGNPFVEILRESYLQDNAGENGVKSTPEVMASQVKGQVLPALRNAAEQLANDDIGIRIKFYYSNDEGVTVETGNLAQFVKDTHEDERPVRVKFLGRPKKIYLTDDQKTEAIEHGFTLGEGDKMRVDTARYLQWVSEAQEDDDDSDETDEEVA